MAGRGPAPKDPEQRRNRAEKQRGEWTDLPATNARRAPKMPTAPRGGWAAGTKLAWRAWWLDPVSLMWSPADVELVRQLAYLHHDLERAESGKATLASEVRQRSDGLGLTQKGKRDFRWRVVTEEVTAARAADPPSAPRRRELHVVN